MDMHNIDAKHAKPVVDVLRSKFPSEHISEILDIYWDPPNLPTLDISKEMVEKVAHTMGVGLEGVNISKLQLLLKTYGGYSEKP